METVGVMFSHPLFKGITHGRTRHEMLTFYEEAGKRFGLKLCYFRLRDISLPQQHVFALIKQGGRYVRQWIPLPRVIHNRALHHKTTSKKKLRRLADHGVVVFNGGTRYSKLHIHRLLMEQVRLRPHLPCTVAANETSLKEMLGMFDSLIIKPDKGSIGRGIMKIDREQDQWRLHFTSEKTNRWRSLTFNETNIPRLLTRRFATRPYIIQQRLDLATYDGRPFDLRISVQRDETGRWQVTGMVGKVAAPHKFVTNVAQGGTVYPLEILLEAYPALLAEQVRNHLIHFSLMVAAQLGNRLTQLADIGLDVGITVHGYPVFIESNSRDLRYSFKECGMIEEWKATHRNPIGYACYVLNGARA